MDIKCLSCRQKATYHKNDYIRDGKPFNPVCKNCNEEVRVTKNIRLFPLGSDLEECNVCLVNRLSNMECECGQKFSAVNGAVRCGDCQYVINVKKNQEKLEKIIEDGKDCLCCGVALTMNDAREIRNDLIIPYHCAECWDINETLFGDMENESLITPGKVIQITSYAYNMDSKKDIYIINYPLINLITPEDINFDSTIDIDNEVIKKHYDIQTVGAGCCINCGETQNLTITEIIVYDEDDDEIPKEQMLNFEKTDHLYERYFDT